MKKIFLFCLVLVLWTAGCKKEKQNEENESTLVNTTWVLSHIEDTGTKAVTYFPGNASGKVSIVFSGTSDVITFTGICNSGTGKYTYSLSGEIKITDLGLTKINCVYVEWEGYASLSLAGAHQYTVNANNLVIYSNGPYNLYFTKQ